MDTNDNQRDENPETPETDNGSFLGSDGLNNEAGVTQTSGQGETGNTAETDAMIAGIPAPDDETPGNTTQELHQPGNDQNGESEESTP